MSTMILLGSYIISLVLSLLRVLKKVFMALTRISPTTPPSSWLSWFSNDDLIKSEEYPHEVLHGNNFLQQKVIFEAHGKAVHDKYPQEENYGILTTKGSDSSPREKVGGDVKASSKSRKRPARLVVPDYSPVSEFCQKDKKLERKEFEVEGKDFSLASKKGRRDVMEDGYGVMLDILGDPTQAFFAVIDGHGGHAATDYVAENLGKNIVKALKRVEKAEDQLEAAIRGGYLVTDEEFLSQGVSGGACAASVLLKGGELHVANVGDCRVVLSRKGVADALTNDHRLSREDERFRIENSGGFVHCRNGVWRVNGSLAVSRAVGDLHLKEWIISEPEIKKLPLTSDCEFLILASDGLWDKVNDQEAVDVVLRDESSVESCKKLVDIASRRGNIDDITVMVIKLQKFVESGGLSRQ
uniref:PPM-type phosphatase domain-containing protein n=1 Tax=Davidia involucrata TaxID=16924 RepID=A0A5B7BV90_DAVIN